MLSQPEVIWTEPCTTCVQGSVRRTVHQAVAAAETSTSVQEAALRAIVAAVKAAHAAKNKKK